MYIFEDNRVYLENCGQEIICTNSNENWMTIA